MQENVSGHRVVKAFAREDFETSKFDKENDKFREANLNTAKIWEKYIPPLDFMCNMVLFIILLVGGFFVSKGAITVGELVVFQGLAQRFNIPMRMLGWLTSDFQRFNASSSKIQELMYAEPGIKNEGIRLSDLDIKERLSSGCKFRVPENHVLHNINFVIEPGQTAALSARQGRAKAR